MHNYAIMNRLSTGWAPSCLSFFSRWKVSVIKGAWHCQGLMGTYGGAADQPWQALLRVAVHGSQMQITMELADHKIAFFSQSAAIERTPSGGLRLTYLYSNLENADTSTLGAYFGHGDIVFSRDGQTASGKYFNNEERKTFGSFELVRIPAREPNRGES